MSEVRNMSYGSDDPIVCSLLGEQVIGAFARGCCSLEREHETTLREIDRVELSRHDYPFNSL